MKNAPADIAGGSTERETALIIRKRYLKTERELAALRSINGLFNFVTVIVALVIGLDLFVRMTTPEYAKTAFATPAWLTATGLPENVLRTGMFVTLVAMIYGFNKLHNTLRPGCGEPWTRPVACVLFAIIATTGFPTVLVVMIPLFFRLLVPDTAIVLSPTYAGVIADTPDLDWTGTRRGFETGAFILILFAIVIALIMWLMTSR